MFATVQLVGLMRRTSHAILDITEPEALRAVGWQPTPAGLRGLRDELRHFRGRFHDRRAGTLSVNRSHQ